MPALTFALTNWKYIVIAALLASILLLKLEAAELETTVANQKVTIGTLTTANLAFAATVKQQNASIELMKTEAQKKELMIKAAMAAAHKASESYRSKALSIERMPLGKDACQNVKTLLESYYKGYLP